jgi:hypothetical protein
MGEGAGGVDIENIRPGNTRIRPTIHGLVIEMK